MKIVFIHDEPQMREVFKNVVSPEHEVILFMDIDAQDTDTLSKIGAELVVIQLGLLGDATAPFVTTLKALAPSIQICVVSGGMTPEIATEMLSAGADKAFCTTDIYRHLNTAGLIKKEFAEI